MGGTDEPVDLTELARRFGTDKWGLHFYTPHYEQHFAPLRAREFTLLEIGVGGYSASGAGGASLRAWEVYFPLARIVGLDIEDKSFVDGGRITTVQGSQTDRHVIESLVEEHGRPLVVIDDGSHVPDDVVATFGMLFPLVEDGGWYVIEDIQTSYWESWGGSRDRSSPDTSMGLVKQLLDGLNYEEFDEPGYLPTYTDLNIVGIHAYHNLVFIQKGRNQEGTNKEAALASRRPRPSRLARLRRILNRSDPGLGSDER